MIKYLIKAQQVQACPELGTAQPQLVLLFVPEIPPKVNGFVTLSGGRVGVQERPPCHSLKMSLLAKGGGCQGKSDNVNLYHVFFLSLSQLGRICYVTLVNIVMLDQKNQDSYVIWVILVISQSIKVSQDRLIKLDWIGQGRIKKKQKKTEFSVKLRTPPTHPH